MIKRISISLMIMLFLFSLSLVYAEVRINEIELNPKDSCSDCSEWIELYSNEETSLEGYKLVDLSNKSFELTGSIKGYKIIEKLSFSLNNDKEQIFLYNSEDLIDSSGIVSDTFNDERSWGYCTGEWKFINSSKTENNPCSIDETPDEISDKNNSKEIRIKADVSEVIINGKEFRADGRAYNLKDEYYDLKIWIQDEDGKITTENYNPSKEEWTDGNYYLQNFFKGGGDENFGVRMRIKKTYENISGSAKLFIKLRQKSDIVTEFNHDVEIILIGEVNQSESSNQEQDDYNYNENPIKLNSKITGEASGRDSGGNSIIYKSRIDSIKVYALGIFLFLCLIFFGVLIIKLAKRKSKNRKIQKEHGKHKKS